MWHSGLRIQHQHSVAQAATVAWVQSLAPELLYAVGMPKKKKKKEEEEEEEEEYMLISALLVQQPNMSKNSGRNKYFICVMERYVAMKRKELQLGMRTWMNLTKITLSKSQKT